MDIQYIAGFFDGEGCICLSDSKYEGYHSYHLKTTIAQNNKEILVEIQKIFGGKVYHSRAKAYFLAIQKKTEVKIFLESILPFLILKKKQAEIALIYLSLDRKFHVGEREICRKILCILKE